MPSESGFIASAGRFVTFGKLATNIFDSVVADSVIADSFVDDSFTADVGFASGADCSVMVCAGEDEPDVIKRGVSTTFCSVFISFSTTNVSEADESDDAPGSDDSDEIESAVSLLA